jgi:hypothetical protein
MRPRSSTVTVAAAGVVVLALIRWSVRASQAILRASRS